MTMIERVAQTEVDPALHLIPEDQLRRVLGQRMCDIDREFLGFTNIYLALASIIPRHWAVVDLGCAYAPQSFIFKDHKAYVGVDRGQDERFAAPNAIHFDMSIEDFIATHLAEFNLDQTFAICSYVPPWGGDNMGMVRSAFKNVFTFYPSGQRNRFPVAALQEGKETGE
ncbi:hypothetical protein G6M50_05920 [Agrobacterium rhizogenes]|nr:hypothetical protein [Rhizobium rhizogenes]NTJ77339.1 hypothetical protein [Rhizobium rhizogenes]